MCEECRDEFCSGNCIVFQYESYQVNKWVVTIKVLNCCVQRMIKGPLNEGENTGKGNNKKKKHKSAKKLWIQIHYAEDLIYVTQVTVCDLNFKFSLKTSHLTCTCCNSCWWFKQWFQFWHYSLKKFNVLHLIV